MSASSVTPVSRSIAPSARFGPGAERAQAEPAGAHPRPHQQPQRPAVDEPGHPARRLEEVERVPRRRRVEHDQVVAPARPHLVEALHRHVLVRARHRPRQLLVDGVSQDPLGRLGRRCLLAHERIERRPGVQHGGVQAARPGHAVRGQVDRVLAVVGLGQAERAGQAPGRVDRQHEHAPAALRHARRERGGRGGLADAAGAGAHRHPGARQELGHVHSPASLSPSSATAATSSRGANRNGSSARHVPSRESCSRWSAARAIAGPGGRRGGGGVAGAAQGLERRRVGGVEQGLDDRVCDHAGKRHPVARRCRRSPRASRSPAAPRRWSPGRPRCEPGPPGTPPPRRPGHAPAPPGRPA